MVCDESATLRCNHIIYRTASENDVATIITMWKAMRSEMGHTATEQDIEEFRRNMVGKILYVAQIEDRIVGFISSVFLSSKSYAELFCEALYIVDGYRGKGVYNKLIGFSLVRAKKLNPALKRTSFSTVYNSRLVKFWGRKGYKPERITFYKEV